MPVAIAVAVAVGVGFDVALAVAGTVVVGAADDDATAVGVVLAGSTGFAGLVAVADAADAVEVPCAFTCVVGADVGSFGL